MGKHERGRDLSHSHPQRPVARYECRRCILATPSITPVDSTFVAMNNDAVFGHVCTACFEMMTEEEKKNYARFSRREAT
jgi:hypothetical protein